MTHPDTPNPCVSCGACCCSFRVSFYWAEADDAPGGHVPAALTEPLNLHLRAMRGTHPHPVRCIALTGRTGESVSCSIYPQRPGPCREFDAWLPDGRANPDCNRVRARIGLPALPDLAPAAEAPQETDYNGIGA
ncbi:YkgJ family cysteine cluster protein [Uliginosibacterium paludis]|jgi:Fe-S-cluster containining protein|uniref:YkgJ family cysteine cluster protein n=1 Tax=Uliginosibacterium paludis TaxID=1615952 RepID=A0ABV2CQJ6_9RHOO